jgi:isopentenyldiphosphate isomerase
MGGIVKAGETPIKAALRELKEEMGITVRVDGLKPNGVWHYHYHMNDNLDKNELIYVYLLKLKGKPDFTLQTSEVQDVKYVTIETLEEMVEHHIAAEHIIPMKAFFIRIINDIKNRIENQE